ncbi:hypothetical protein ONZ51_g8328 [Trametes cubensis]|uniref:Large ribosomal subunit protein eL39 n=1 Tax=Trametes cubensis TaxID=1111947 RepID=A0AAD7X6M6_9APHY|nr:hypothetical protein ONZ51_g8328 [Trametes cubensis]
MHTFRIRELSQNCTGHTPTNLNFPPFSTNRRRPAYDIKNDGMSLRFTIFASPSQKTFRTKRILAKASRQNRPIPQWFRLKSDTKIQYNAKRRHWRRTKLNI